MNYTPEQEPYTDAPRRLILASGSPRRKELLALCGIPFEIIVSDVEEDLLEKEMREFHREKPFLHMAAHVVMGLAESKAAKIFAANPNDVVIGADTVVVLGGIILGKPSSKEEAFAMLKRLSGRTHRVLTGISIQSRETLETFYTETKVTFHPWKAGGEALTRRYVATGSPMDKAGAYGVQDLGALFVKEIRGDYYTVMGFPIAEVYRRLLPYFPSATMSNL